MPENQASTLELLVGVARGRGPLQRQVEDQLRAAIRSGRLAAGERLPASRVLSADLGVSRGVVSDAYAQLAAEGWLVVAPRSRPRVAAAASGPAGTAAGGAVARSEREAARAAAAASGPAGTAAGGAVARSEREAARAAAVSGAAAAGGAAASSGREAARAAAVDGPAAGVGRPATGAAAPAAPVRYDLRPGRPDLARFPRADWIRSLSAAVRAAGVAELDYPPIPGATALREVLAAYRGRVRGTVARAEDVILCAGAGQAFVVVAEALGPGRIAVEDPGHEEIRELVAGRGLEPVPVRVDDDGIVVAELPDDVRAVLLTPAHQFPTGAVLSAERRAALLRWAEAHDVLIIEDDYDAEYRYDRAPIGALQGLRPDLVAHVGSVSKTLAPALRLGWLIAPPRWREAMLSARASLDHGLPALEQLALADFITRGAYDRHLRRSGRAYRRRRDALIDALSSMLPGATVSGAAAGLHIAVHIPGADEPALVAACRAAGVIVDGITPHRVAPGAPGLLISFAAVPDAAAGHVAQLIAAAASEVSRRRLARPDETGAPPTARGRSAFGDDVVERLSVRALDPLLGRAALRVARNLWIAEREDGRDLLALAHADGGGHRVGVGRPIGTRADALVVRGEHHVLGGPAGVEPERPATGDDDRDEQRGAAHVRRLEHRRGDPLAISQHDEPPLLAVARASRQPAGLEDPAHGVVGQRPVGVGADLALGDDGQEGVHQGAGSVISAPPIRAVASGVRCDQLTSTVTPATVKVALAAPEDASHVPVPSTLGVGDEADAAQRERVACAP